MLTKRRMTWVALLAGAALLVASPLALSASPRSGRWVGKVVKGLALKGKNGEPTFRVGGGKLTNFTIRGVGAFCFSGYSVIPVHVPSVAIHNGRFSRTYHPGPGANIKLSGRFLSATRAKGTVVGNGRACDYTIGFVAHRV